jgi:hypothetical protein
MKIGHPDPRYLALICLLAGGAVHAAPAPPPFCKIVIDSWHKPGDPKLSVEIGALADVAAGNGLECAWQVLYGLRAPFPKSTPSVSSDAAFQAQAASNSVQAGSAAGSAGTTSAVSKPITPMSLATEYGGITSSTSNQTITLQIPLDGIPRALTAKGDVPYCSSPLIQFKNCAKGPTLSFFDRFGITASMNTSTRAGDIVATALGSGSANSQQVNAMASGSMAPSFSGSSFKWAIVRPNVDMSKLKIDDVKSAAAAEATESQKLFNSLQSQQRYNDWHDCVVKQFQDPMNDRYDVFAKYYTQLKPILLLGATVDCSPTPAAAPAVPQVAPEPVAPALKIFDDYIRQVSIVQARFDSAVATAVGGLTPILSFEYDYAAPQNQMTNSTFKLVGGWNWPKPKSSNAPSTWTATLNIGASIFNTRPAASVPQASLLRDLQAGAELDRVISSSKWPLLGKLGDSTASLAFYYQDQTSPSILTVTPGTPVPGVTLVGIPSTATQVFTQKGVIRVGQLKYGFGTGKNVKFPFAITYSSRTELIAHPVWGAQFGVTYDFSSLLSGTTTAK